MKGLEEFKIYLKKWCDKNHKPCPEVDQINETWQKAWEDFVKEELKPEWGVRKQEYLNMKLMTHKDMMKKETEIEEKESSSWDKVKEMLD